MQKPDLKALGKYRNSLQQNIPLARYSFALCGGPAAALITADDPGALEDIVSICMENAISFKVLGGLSNVLISDAGFDGLIILNRTGRISLIDDAGPCLIQAGSGSMLNAIVRYCEANALSGMEWAAGIPGTLGGAVYGNAGAFGSDISNCLESAELLDSAGKRKSVRGTEMDLSYRSSSLKKSSDPCIILSARIQLSKGIAEEIIEKGRLNREKRSESQPHGVGSLGSVFKNPAGTSAGKLIEDAGLKGTRIGEAEISQKHANFITTSNGVKSADYKALIELAQQKVFEQFGIRLEPEIEMLGFQGA